MQRRTLLASVLTVIGARGARAAEFPARPVTMVVGYAAGGAVDVVARIVAERLRVDLGQQVVVENRPGAAGLSASVAVARAPADGYTITLGANGTMVINPQLLKQPPFSAADDFTAISLTAINDGVLVVTPGFPAKTLAEFVQVVKAAPGKYFFASSGTGGSTHLGGELINETVGIEMHHVPYQGDAPALVDVMAGRVPIMVTVMPSVIGQLRSGKVRAIAALGERRFPEFPDLPAIDETYPGLTVSAWLGLFGPKGLAADVVGALNAAARKSLADPVTLKRLADVGSIGRASSPEEMHALAVADFAKWKLIIKKVGLAPK